MMTRKIQIKAEENSPEDAAVVKDVSADQADQAP
jgi:hypothetical protein